MKCLPQLLESTLLNDEEHVSCVRWLNLSREVFPVASKNEWSCFYPLRCEIAAVFGRSVRVNVLSEVPLPIPLHRPG